MGGSGNYTDEQLLSELWRMNHDPNTGYTFAAGDRVRVTGWYKFYKGKINVNEKHKTDPFYDLECRAGHAGGRIASAGNYYPRYGEGRQQPVYL